MEWLPIFVVAILIAILGLYSIVKKAVRDALKEHLSSKDKEDKSVFEEGSKSFTLRQENSPLS